MPALTLSCVERSWKASDSCSFLKAFSNSPDTTATRTHVSIRHNFIFAETVVVVLVIVVVVVVVVAVVVVVVVVIFRHLVPRRK